MVLANWVMKNATDPTKKKGTFGNSIDDMPSELIMGRQTCSEQQV